MTRFVINANPAYIKVLKNDADNPDTTPDTDYGKFKFNSNNALIGYTFGMRAVPSRNDLAVPSGNGYFPGNVYTLEPGWTVFVFKVNSVENPGPYWYHFIKLRVLFGTDFPPLNEFKVRTIGSNEFHSSIMWSSLFYDVGGRVYGHLIVSTSRGNGVAYAPYLDNATYEPEMLETSRISYQSGNRIWAGGTTVALANVEASIIAWDLPSDETDPFPPAATPVAGQKTLRLDATAVKLARPGYDVETATGRQLIIDSNRIPTKVIACGEFTITGGNTFDVMIDPIWHPLSPQTFVDIISQPLGMAGNTQFPFCTPPAGYIGWVDSPGIPSAQNRTPIWYTVLTDRVRFRANSWVSAPSQLVRYVVFADDDGGTTSGGTGAVLEAKTDAVPPYVRILRPGAQNPPKMRDVILDTRASYVPIVATGWINRADFTIVSDDLRLGTHMSPPIPFANSGFLPFVKLAIVTSRYNGAGTILIRDKEYCGQPDFVRLYNNTDSTWSNKPNGATVVAVINNNSIRIYANPDSPYSTQNNGSGNVRNYAIKLKGVRYYVFGLPTS